MEEKQRTAYTCNICSKNPANPKGRRCQEPGLDNYKAPKRVDKSCVELYFCPGKATWFPEVIEIFEQCRVTLETGILPKAGSFEDQDFLFTEALPVFIERWNYRNYIRVWRDVGDFTDNVLEAIFGKKNKGAK